ADRNRSHWSTSKTPSYTKSVSWQHHPGNDKAIASSNDTVGYYLYLGDNSDVLDVSAPFNIESYKTAEGQYAIPFKAKYLKLTDNSVQSGDVLSSLVMRVAQD
ncbi:hypothetical protein ABN334_20410, partial [Escherichia coli]|nr:hypothetical protein [Escherichia coli]MDT1161176.1 hypothetical protein [Escherichia coli]MDT9090409.1 hypothetical protein [Escherichia coli]MDV0884527.1 hypothetical protein [Escherichia coli]MDW7031354.1 hypothetical protein [Escherichia coli]